MAQNHTVKQGDCISSIAYEHGFFPDTIWNHPQNKELKEKRKDPNILFPGDVVFVPDKRVKEVSKATDQVHKFRMKNVPAMLIVVLEYFGELIKNEVYKLDIDGVETEGKTDSEGKVSVPIPPNASKGKLVVGEGDRQITYNLYLGQIDPIDEVKGWKKRLENLGYDVGVLDGTESEDLTAAIKAFEADHDLEIKGEMAGPTKEKLAEIFGR